MVNNVVLHHIIAYNAVMDIETLRIFAECIEKLSFGRVAENRKVHPTTISRAISSLESELSLKLFNRNTRNVQPTKAGYAYYESVKPLIEKLLIAQQQVSDHNQSAKGLLRICSTVVFGQKKIAPLLHKFCAKYPDINIEFILSDWELDLISHDIDVGIRIPTPKDSQIITVKLSDMTMHVCASPEYIRKCGQPQKPSDIEKHPCLTLEHYGFDTHTWKFHHKKTGKKENITVKSKVATSNAIVTKQLALDGVGIALLSTWAADEELKTGQLVDLFPNINVTSSYENPAAWLVYPSREYIPYKTRVFVDFIKQSFQQ